LTRRSVVAPSREVPLLSAPVRVPDAIVEAESMAREDRSFSFDKSAPAAIEVIERRPAQTDDEDEFRFFAD